MKIFSNQFFSIDITYLRSKICFDEDFLKYIPTHFTNMKVSTTPLAQSIKYRTPYRLNPIKIISPTKYSLITLIKDNIVYNHQLKVPIMREEKRSSSFFNFFTATKNIQMVKMTDTEIFQMVRKLS